MRLIDADALPIKFDGHIVAVWKNDIDNAPTVDAVLVRHGHWETDERYPWRGVCSECHMYITYDADSNAEMNYCPNCGAKMDEVT